MENYHEEIHTLGCGCNSVYIACNLGNGQQVISEPGYCAQFYPNANCQNEGPNNPYTGVENAVLDIS